MEEGKKGVVERVCCAWKECFFTALVSCTKNVFMKY